MKEFWPHILLLLASLISLALLTPTLTGMSTHQISVSVKSNFSGELSAFIYDTISNVSETQDIYVEFANIGTETYDVKIEEYIYSYDEDGMEQEAYYYDSTVTLYPGMRRPFETKFVPNQMGYYYIKVRISMNTKKMEVWGSFYATYPDYNPYVPAQYQPYGTYAEPRTSLLVEYPNVIDLKPGRSTMTSIKVKNTGNVTMHEVKMHLSSSNYLDIDMNPKESYYLDPNKTISFILDIYAQNKIPVGEYPIDFELVTRETKETGKIIVNVSSYNVSLEEELEERLLNYELMLIDIERETIDAFGSGINTSIVDSKLENARAELTLAKNLFSENDFEGTQESLEIVKEIIKEAAFDLAQASFVVFVSPAFSPLWLLALIIAIAIAILLIERRRKQSERKPKLLRLEES